MGIKSNKRSHTKIVEQYLGTAYDVVKKVYDHLSDLSTIAHVAENNRGADGVTPVKGVDYTDGYTPVKGLDYKDGESGKYYSFIFKNGATAPTTPTGGEYTGETEVIPLNWTDDPVSSADDEYVWVSKAVYSVDGEGNWTHTGWSSPAKFSGEKGYTPRHGIDYFDGKSGAYHSYVFQNGVNITLKPVGGTFDGVDETTPVGWTDDPVSPLEGQYVFVSKAIYKEDDLGNWVHSGWSTPARFSGVEGYTPIAGQDYFDGKAGRFTSYVYKLSSTAPAQPSGGSFDGNNETIPATWTDDIVTPSQGTYIWISKRTYEVNAEGNWVGTAWSLPKKFSGDDGYTPVKGQDYVDGKDGSFHSWIYRNDTAIPDVPLGGTYNGVTEAVPTGWTDDPVLPSPVEDTYVSKAIYTQQADGTWDKIGWSTPSKFSGADGRNAEIPSIIFRNSASKPATPTIGSGSYDDTRTPKEITPTNWSKTATEPTGNESTWMAQRTYSYDVATSTWVGTAWSDVIKVSGKDGVSKNIFPIRIYTRSVMPPPTPTSGSYNFDSKTFTPPMGWTMLIPDGSDQIYATVGIAESDTNGGGIDSSIPWDAPVVYQGAVGETGKSGQSVYQAVIFKRSATTLTATDTPPNGSGSFNFTDNVLTPPTGWAGNIPAGTDPIYVCQTTFSIIGDTGTDTAGVWTDPVLLARSGDDGSSILFQGSYASAPTSPQTNWAYYNTTDKKSYLYNGTSWTQLTEAPTDGEDGQSIIHKGALASAPINPIKNWTYRNTGDGIVYIYNGSAWEPMVYDGVGTDGKSVFVRFNDAAAEGTAPAKPVQADGLDGGWTEDSTGSSNWMVQKTAKTLSEGTWGTPFRIVGLDGSNGTNGTHGLSTYRYPIFIRDADGVVATPSGGEYSFTANSITLPAGGWSETIPDGDDPVYVSYATVSIQGAVGVDTSPTYTAPKLFVKNGDVPAINYASKEAWVLDPAVSSAPAKYHDPFVINGSDFENKIELRTGPWGRPSILWVAHNTDVDSGSDGGWNKYIDVDPAKSYLSIIYFKYVKRPADGSFYHGCGNGYQVGSATLNTNPYFNAEAHSTFEEDVWYVSVGILHSKDSTLATPTNRGGIFRVGDGTKIQENLEFIQSDNTRERYRVYNYYSTDNTGEMEFDLPGFYEINGSEPQIDQITGKAGLRAPRTFIISEPVWDNQEAVNAVLSAENEIVNGDLVTINDPNSEFTETREWDGGYYFKTGTININQWVSVAELIDGNLVVLGTIKAEHLKTKTIKAEQVDTDDLFTETVHATNEIIVGASSSTGKRVSLHATHESPIRVFDSNNELLLDFTANVQDVDGVAQTGSILNFRGQLGDKTIRSISAFSTDVWDKIQPKVPGSTGGTVHAASGTLPINMTTTTELPVITLANGNNSDMTIIVAFNDSGDTGWQTTQIAAEVTAPSYTVEVYRNSETVAFASVPFEGDASVTSNNKSGSEARYKGVYSIDVVTNIIDNGHLMSADGGDSTSYTIKIIHNTDTEKNAPKVTSQTIAQEIRTGDAIGLGTENNWLASQDFTAGIKQDGQVILNGTDTWLRTHSSTGWYNETYGGGMYMQDASWVRVFNNKRFYVSNTSHDAIQTAGGIKAKSLNSYDSQALVLNAGESISYANGQTAEYVYVNAEEGLNVNCAVSNWTGGWANRYSHTLGRLGLQLSSGMARITTDASWLDIMSSGSSGKGVRMASLFVGGTYNDATNTSGILATGLIDSKTGLKAYLGANPNVDTHRDYFYTSYVSNADAGTIDSYMAVANFGGGSSTRGFQIAASYSSTDSFQVRRRSDNANSENGAGLQNWKTLALLEREQTFTERQFIVRNGNTTIGSANSANSWLTIGSDANGIHMDDNEFYKTGGTFYFGTMTYHTMDFRQNASTFLFNDGLATKFARDNVEIREDLTVEKNLIVDGAITEGGYAVAKKGGVALNYQEITVGGDANTYYPVIIKPTGYEYGSAVYHVSRQYGWTAPDTWNTATHRGGLTLSFMWSGDGAWGGNDKMLRVLQFNETYSSQCAGIRLAKRGMTVWLRGGGATYRISGERQAIGGVEIHDTVSGFTDTDGVDFLPYTTNDTVDRDRIFNHYPIRDNGEVRFERTVASKNIIEANGGVRLGVDNILSFDGADSYYLRESNGSYGTISAWGRKGGWSGYSLENRSVLMHDGADQTGLYNDVDNEWWFLAYRNAGINFYYNGSLKAQTSSNGFKVHGTLDNQGSVVANGNFQITSASGVLNHNNTSSYDKIRVWNSSAYTIGMNSAQTYGWLNDYAMTFTMNPETDRGFLWRDTSDAASDGAMSLTTHGYLMVKDRIGFKNYQSTYLTGDGTYIQARTAHGYLNFGAGNTTFCHFYTDLPEYYFNKGLVVDTGIVRSYDEDLILRRAGSSATQIRVSATAVTSSLPITASAFNGDASNALLLGGVSPSNYARKDADSTITANYYFPDGYKVEWGDQSDYIAYFDTNNMVFRGYTHGKGVYFQQEGTDGVLKTCAVFGGSTTRVTLYWNGLQRLITTSTGVDITGELEATGQVRGSSWRSTSALKYKDVYHVDSGYSSLNKVVKIGSQGVSVGKFNDGRDDDTHRWFIADDVAPIMPEVVGYKDGEVENLNYQEMVPDAYAAIAEQQKMIDAQAEKIKRLEFLVEELLRGK